MLFEWEQYKDNLLSVFQINKGGLAIYGGILGGVAVVLIYCKVKELSFWSLADTLIPSLVLGQAIGRWGNFVNQETYGNLITNLDLQFFPYDVYIEELGQWHQATFFYESALNTLLLIVMLIGGLQSCSALVGAAGGGVAASSYQSEDADILAAEAAYCALEAELQEYLDTYERTHDYDEYHYDLDEIKHDPYVLASILSALHDGAWTASEVQGTLQMLFEKQYILTETVVTEVRYRTVTRTDSEGNEYEVEVPYNYYICTVELENFDLSHIPVYIMDEETLSKYALYMSVLGNREDLFGDSPYVDKYITNPPADYDVNPEYLNDEKFAALITEAEKYLGYPYVWGGSNPDTSFDCSGFVSYVLTNSGLVNTGRLGAQGLYNVCTPVSKANAQPGDLIFFVGTYDTPGVSHVGIYVGDGVMIHCGDPIQYTSINSSYWQQHFYAFGRPAY